jgi:hypothetical protein
MHAHLLTISHHLSKMASKMSYEKIINQVRERQAALNKEEEVKINSCYQDMDRRIGEAINRATSMPITYTYPEELKDDIMKAAWHRLKNKYNEIFGCMCEMTTETRKFKEYDGKGDEWEVTKTYGKFTLKE